jgi:hypothetical protein
VGRVTRAPFVVDNAHTQKIRLRGLTFLLDWLEDQPGRTWQERWLASGADAAGAGWRKIPARWLQEHDLVADWRLGGGSSSRLDAYDCDPVSGQFRGLEIRTLAGPCSAVQCSAVRVQRGAAVVFGAGGDYCDYPSEPSGQHGQSWTCWLWQ